jgi:hypothetical protein
MKRFPLSILFGLLVVGCSPTKNKNVENEDLGAMARKATGVFVDHADSNDSILFYFEESGDAGNECLGFMSQEFALTEDGFLVNAVSQEDQLILFQRNGKLLIRTTPSFGDTIESEVVFVTDTRMRVEEREFEKVTSIE